MTLQDRINDFCWKYGTRDRAVLEHCDLLALHGLSVEQLTPERIARAEELVRQRLHALFAKPVLDKVSSSGNLVRPRSGERIVQIQEADARKLLVDLCYKNAEDPEAFPASRLARYFNEESRRVELVEQLDRLEGASLDLLNSIGDAVKEGETIVVIPQNGEAVKHAETSEEETPVSTATAPAPAPKRRGRPPKNRSEQTTAPANGQKKALVVPGPKHREVRWKIDDKARLLKVNYSLAKRIRDLERYPHDRNLSPARCEYIRDAIRAGTFRGSEWVSAHCRENNVTYRVNGKHTSAVVCDLYEAKEEFPEFYQLVSEYECDTMEDVAQLFATFDPRQSVRSKGDVIRGFAAVEEATRNLPPRMLTLATSGLAYAVWEGAAKKQSTTEQSLLLIQNTDFVKWVVELLGNKKNAEHLRRMPVIAAMYRTWRRTAGVALEFWTKLRDDCDDPKDSPVRKLYRLLLAKKIGAVKKTSESISAREAYLRCLLAWNAHRSGNKEEAFHEDMETPSVL